MGALPCPPESTHVDAGKSVESASRSTVGHRTARRGAVSTLRTALGTRLATVVARHARLRRTTPSRRATVLSLAGPAAGNDRIWNGAAMRQPAPHRAARRPRFRAVDPRARTCGRGARGGTALRSRHRCNAGRCRYAAPGRQGRWPASRIRLPAPRRPQRARPGRPGVL